MKYSYLIVFVLIIVSKLVFAQNPPALIGTKEGFPPVVVKVDSMKADEIYSKCKRLSSI